MSPVLQSNRLRSMPQLTTARLRLEPFTDAHVNGLNALNADPEVMRYISGRPERLEETVGIVQRVKQRWIDCGYSWWSFIDHRHAIRALNGNGDGLLPNYCAAPTAEAVIQDGPWCASPRSLSRETTAVDRQARLQSSLRKERAIDTRLAQEDFPARVFANQLGAMVGLSHSQAGDAVRSDPGLRSAIDAANAGKPSRQVAWAISRLREQGIALTKTNVGRRARLPRPDVTRVLAANPSLDADFKASIEP
jgi:hypothetical protein